MQCNAGGAQCKAQGQALDSGMESCTDRHRLSRRAWQHLAPAWSAPDSVPCVPCCCSTSHPAQGKRMQDPACPPCPFLSLLPCQTTPDSLGKCMQVLGTQSNLPTLLLSIRLADSLSPGPHTSKYIHYTAGEMTTPSHASRLTTTGDQQQSTAVPFCPVWNACTVPEIST